MTIDFVRLGELTLGRATSLPGWRWSEHVKPLVGTDLCQVHHRGIVLAGSLGLEFADGSRMDIETGDVYDIPPEHDGWTIGDEPCVLLDVSNQFLEFGTPTGGERVLTTLLFTDIVGSTQLAERIGDREWKRLLAEHDLALRNEVERFRGRVVGWTGDGLLARFDGAARALDSGLAIAAVARRLGLEIRVGVHTGEVELAGTDLRGIAVHEAARIMALAGPGEVLTSDLTRLLAGGSGGGIAFEDRGEVELRGVSGARQVFAVRRG